jgi:hypothetical protein
MHMGCGALGARHSPRPLRGGKLVHGSGGQRREIASTQKLARLPAWSRQTPDLFTIAAFPIPQKRFMVAGGSHQR